MSNSRSNKVLLIWPNALNSVVADEYFAISNEFGKKPPLGLLYIESMLSQHSDYQVKVYDADASNAGDEALRRMLSDYQPDIVGISAWTDFWYDCCRTIKIVKEECQQSHVCVGGPHVGIFPRETLARDDVDSIIVGDGERPFLRLCQNLFGDQQNHEQVGLYTKCVLKDDIIYQPYIEIDIDDLPFPHRKILDIEKYRSIVGRNNKMTTLITSRGCPNRCIFCRLNYQKTKLHSPDYVLKEIEDIVRSNIHDIEIYDDTFNISKERVETICREIIEQRWKISWSCRARVDKVDRHIAQMMKEAGCKRVHFGVESGSERILERIGKNITLDQCKSAFQHAHAAGLETVGFFMIGFPDETRADIQKTIDFAKKLSPDYAQFSLTIPYPGTSLYYYGLKKGLYDDYWKEFSLNPQPKFMSRFWTENISTEELYKFKKKAFKDFYFRPRQVLRITRNYLKKNNMCKLVRLGCGMLKELWMQQ